MKIRINQQPLKSSIWTCSLALCSILLLDFALLAQQAPARRDCGAMAVFLVLEDLRKGVEYESLVEVLFEKFKKREGYSLLEMKRALLHWGVYSKPASVPGGFFDDIGNAEGRWIGLMDTGGTEPHFVYIRLRGGSIQIFDLFSTGGKMNGADFRKAFTGYVLVIE